MKKIAYIEVAGWFHTGFDSYDNPEIRYAEKEVYLGPAFGHGPFKTWDEAHRDLLAEASEMERHAGMLKMAAIALQRPKTKRQKK